MRTKAPMLAEVKGWMDVDGERGLLMERLEPIRLEQKKTVDFCDVQRQGVNVCCTEEELRQFALKNGLYFDDLMRSSHWGISKDRTLKVLDYGWTADVWRAYNI
ncbi:hypothetical protein LR68_04484 [Anoxybacillus sp. BCO1]|nr:hypothetical protein LR68_04484 [Anoxybacillus sp. BCO1]